MSTNKSKNITVKREDLSKDSTISSLVLYLESIIEDKCPREKISDYDLGIKVGQLMLLDMIRSIWCLYTWRTLNHFLQNKY